MSGYLVETRLWSNAPLVSVRAYEGEGFLRSLFHLLEWELMSRIGHAAQDSVRQRFLLPRLALDYLKIADKTLGGGTYANGRRGAQGLLST